MGVVQKKNISKSQNQNFTAKSYKKEEKTLSFHLPPAFLELNRLHEGCRLGTIAPSILEDVSKYEELRASGSFLHG